MVGIVIVTHSKKLSEGIIDEVNIMANGCLIKAAGGSDNDDYGTSYNKIKNAIESVYSEDGVIVLADIGSSIMTSEMVIEELGYENIKLLDCPIVEGSIVASIAAKNGNNLDEIVQEVLNTSLNKR